MVAPSAFIGPPTRSAPFSDRCSGIALLGWAQGLAWVDPAGPFRFVFWLALIPELLAVIVFLVIVRDPEQSPNPKLRPLAIISELPTRFKRYIGAVGLFGLGDFSHSLLILAATQLLTPALGVVGAAQVAGVLYRHHLKVLQSTPPATARSWRLARPRLW